MGVTLRTFVFVSVAMLAVVPVSASDRQLPDGVERVLRAYSMSPDSVSVFVQRIDEKFPVLEWHADEARNPASTIKVLTTWLALDTLGPAYTWPTEAYAAGALSDGRLQGDLVLKGYGDPYLVTERLWLFVRQIMLAGVTDVSGDLVIDDTFFDVATGGRGDFDGQAFRSYNVLPSAFLVNFHAVNFVFRPDATNGGVAVLADPLPENLRIRNELRLKEGGCGGYQNGIAVNIVNSPVFDEIVFSGRYGRRCDQYSMTRSVLSAPDFGYGVFSALWAEAGGQIGGAFRQGSAPDSGEPVASIDSPPLADVITAVNKFSNNVMTRHLFLTLGADRFEPPATLAKARRATSELLDERGLDLPQLVVDNGSGLSRDSRVSARGLGRVLLAARHSQYQAEFESSLALAGLDGTMRRRFRNSDLTGRLRIKTGRLDGVFAMAGYVMSRDGSRYAVAAMQNHPDAHRGPGEEALSALLRWIYLTNPTAD